MRDENDNLMLPARGARRYIDIYEQLLDETIGPSWIEDPSLQETPARMAKAWVFWTSGYDEDLRPLLKTFPAPDGASEMIVVKDLPFFSLCEHHGAPFFGTATIAYIPTQRIIGLSKFGRIVDAFARRLQVQERLTNEIADALHTAPELLPEGVGVIVRARHLCMESRGLCKQGQTTVTSALRGCMGGATARAEFLALAAG